MSEDLLARAKGEEPPETPYPHPTPEPRSDVNNDYDMSGDESDVEEPDEPIEEKKYSKKLSEREKQAAFFRGFKEHDETVKTEETEEPYVEVTTNSSEPETDKSVKTEKKSHRPPTPVDDGDADDRISKIEEKIKDFDTEIYSLKKTITEKNEEIELLTRANADLFLIDMQTLAEDLNDFRGILLDIGAENYFKEIADDEKFHGPHLAYKKAMRFFDDARKNAREGLPILTAIENKMNMLQEKIKFAEEV